MRLLSRTCERHLPPGFGSADVDDLIRLMGDLRQRAHLCGGAAGLGSPRDRLCDAMCKAIDALAADLTGDREYFGDKMHADPV